MTLSRQTNSHRTQEALGKSLCEATPEKPMAAEVWWIAQVLSQAEERIVEAVNAAGGNAVSPRESVLKWYEDRKTGRFVKRVWTRPVFPSYVFYAGDRDRIFGTPRNPTQGVLRVIETRDHDWEQIGKLVLAYNAGPIRRVDSMKLTPGLFVKVVAGPYRGVEGYVERFGDSRVFLKVSHAGMAEFSTDRSNIEPFFGD